MTRKHPAYMTDAWRQQHRPAISAGAGQDWQPKPMTAAERQARLERFEDQRSRGDRQVKAVPL